MSKIIFFLALVCTAWLVLPVSAQDKREKLRKELNMARGDKAIELTIELAKSYNEVNTDSSIQLMQSLLNDKNKKLTPTHRADAYRVLSNALTMQNRLAESLNEARKAYDLYELLQDSAGISAVLSSIGTIHFERGNYKLALDYYLQALAYKEALGQINGVASLRCNIGNIYMNQRQFEQARSHYQQAQEMFVKSGNRMGVSYTHNNLGVIFEESGDLEKAIQSYRESLKIDTELGDKFGMASANFNLGEIHAKTNQLSLASSYYKKALRYAQEIANPSQISAAIMGQARIARITGRLNESIGLSQTALEIARAATDRPIQLEALTNLSETYEKAGDFRQSLKATRELMVVKDSIEAEHRRLLTAESQTRYETDKKEKEIELLQKDASIKESLFKRQSLLNKVYIGAIGLALLFIALLFNRFQITKKNGAELHKLNASLEEKVDQRTADLKQALEQAEKAGQLKSFFLANVNHELRKPMNAILGLGSYLQAQAKDEEIGQIAQELLDSGNRLSKTMTSILELGAIEDGTKQITKEAVRPDEIVMACMKEFENEVVVKSLKLELVNYAGEQTVSSHAGYLGKIIHALLENAVKYTEQGKIKIELLRELWAGEPSYSFRIQDTGSGIPATELKHIFEAFRTGDAQIDRGFEGLGIGLTLARKYAELLGGQISVDSRVNHGSIFTLRIPMHG